MGKLTIRQARFVELYLVELNGTKAYLGAYPGGSLRCAESQSSRMLRLPKVAAAIMEAKRDQSERTKIDADYVLRRHAEIDQMDVADIIDDDGDLKPLKDWPKHWRQTISGLDVQAIKDGDSEAIIKKIKWPDKLRNLELLGRHVDVQAYKDNIDLGLSVTNMTRDELIEKARELIDAG